MTVAPHCDGQMSLLDSARDEAEPLTPGRSLRRNEWQVRPITQREAVTFIEATHYAMGAPNTSVARHGLFRAHGGSLLGVSLWLPPTKPAAVSVNRDNWQGVLSLSRLCVHAAAPKNAASFLLGASMAQLDRGRWPTLLTYADTALGHTGAIYLATNWTRLGEVPGSDNWVGPDGERRGRKRGGRNLSVGEMRDLGFTRLPAMPKIKYVHHAASVALVREDVA